MQLHATEHQIQQAIIGYLQFKGYYVQRMNSGKFVAGEGISRRMIHGARPGTPDIMAFKKSTTRLFDEELQQEVEFGGLHPDLLFVEVKRPGNKPTSLQKAIMQELTDHGARCIVAHSVEEVEALL